MKFSPARLTTILNAAASLAATLLPVLVEQRIISASTAATAGTVLTSLLLGWHGNKAVANRQAKTQP